MCFYGKNIRIYPELSERKFGGKPAGLADVRRYYFFFIRAN